MRPTLRQVAQNLKLSPTTVSRALDGYDDVAEDTRKLVVETAKRMGYAPNRAARQLRRQRTDAIGYIIPSLGAGFADPFFSEFVAGLGDEASIHGYDLLVTTAQPARSAEHRLYRRWAQSHKVDGMVVNRVLMRDWRLEYLAKQKIPHVSLEQSLFQRDFVGIETDPREGILELMSHLFSHGHSRIAYIGGDPELKIDHDRYNAYADGLRAASIIPDPRFVARADLTSDGGYQAAMNLLTMDTPPTSLICINDLTAIGAMHAAHDHGLIVGHAFAIAGVDGIAASAHTQPPLTTLSQPVYDIARKLVKMLMALINDLPLDNRQVKIQPKLLLRESTGI